MWREHNRPQVKQAVATRQQTSRWMMVMSMVLTWETAIDAS